MTIGPAPICLSCKHFIIPETSEGLTCKAFPDKIPRPIILGNKSHIEPIDGDNGFQFKALEGKELKARQKALRNWPGG